MDGKNDERSMEIQEGSRTISGIPYSVLCEYNYFVMGVACTFLYTNHRGERALRKAVPLHLMYSQPKVHCPNSTDNEDQWLLVCFDLDKGAIRHFSLKNIEPR